MTLNNTHREILIRELSKTKEEISLGNSIISREQQTEHYKDWQDIKMFLLQERVKLIKKSLIDNEIDF
jgi:hypothetical protein